MVWLSAFSTPFMLSAVNVALPSIARALHLNAVVLSWVPLIYLLASAMFVLMFGKLADLRGRKRIFLIGSAGVMASSLLAALATNGAQLLSFRFLQGVFTAALYATQIAIVSAAFPPARRGHAIGLTISSVYVGLTAGPAIGGYLLEIFDWRACLLVQVPFSIAILWLGLRRVGAEAGGEGHGTFDFAGTFLYMLTLAAVIGGSSFLPARAGWTLLVIGATALVLFVVVERRMEHPIFDLKLFFANRVFGMSCLAAFLMYTAVFANVVLVGLYLQYLHALPPGKAGLVMMAQPLTMALFAPIAGRLSDRIEPRWLASAGMLVTSVGLLGLGALQPDSSIPHVTGALVATGIGFGLFSAPNTHAIMSAVDKRQYGTANSKVATMRLLGQMCSMGIITVVFALMLGPVPIAPEIYDRLHTALRTCYFAAAVLCVPAIFLSLARGTVHAAGYRQSA
ncbi:MAG: Riboflavin transporter RibZ [Gammaproteobacteria bacterium]|nr:Riboflavin transporter RibZ [Gammaproteobacteria bacterium]